MNGLMDTIVGWLLGVVAVVVGWAWTIDRRVGKLETLNEAASAKLDRLDEKMDRLIDKLL